MNLSQYIVIRHPVSLQKILYARSNGTIIYKTKYNEYCKENIKLFKAGNFIAELTQHIPPKHKHLIRYYGLYSSRTKGKAHKDGSLAKYGYRARPKKTTDKLPDSEMESVSNKASRRSWARLIQKVYEVDPKYMDVRVSAQTRMSKSRPMCRATKESPRGNARVSAEPGDRAERGSARGKSGSRPLVCPKCGSEMSKMPLVAKMPLVPEATE